MDCHLFKLLVQKYHDGELGAAEKAKFESHLDACAECRAFEQKYRSVFGALEGIGIYEPSHSFNEMVMARVDTGRYRKSTVRKFFSAVSWKWNLLPGYIRITSSLAAFFAIFMYVFRPIFLALVTAAEKFITLVGSLSILAGEADKLFDTVVNYFKSDPEFIVAAKILLRKFQQLGDEIPYSYLFGIFALTILIILIVARVSRSSWRKGESNVGSF